LISKKTILVLALGTLLFFGGLGFFFIPMVRETSTYHFILGFKQLWLQVLIGLVFGIITARAGWQIVELPKLFKTKVFFSQIIKPLNLSMMEIIVI